VARKPNYDFEKRKKELERKNKQAEKVRRKREARELEEGGQQQTGPDGESLPPQE
jgi:hypothetical protein